MCNCIEIPEKQKGYTKSKYTDASAKLLGLKLSKVGRLRKRLCVSSYGLQHESGLSSEQIWAVEYGVSGSEENAEKCLLLLLNPNSKCVNFPGAAADRAQRARNATRWRSKKIATDVQFALRCKLSSRILMALKSTKSRKAHPTFKLTGCTMDFLKQHLESQFTEGMNWNNQGKWHIDHRKPCALFDLTKESEQITCFNWSNLQPLWAFDNLSKGKKYDAVTA